MSIEDWNNICNRKFVENFSLPEAQKHFLRLSYFRRQGHDEENAMKGLKAEENIQWKIACYKAEENLEKSVAEDLRKSYSANHWESRAKKIPDLKSAIQAINAIAGNWCGYTPYNGTGFGDKGVPELPPYKLNTDNEMIPKGSIQELFDSIGQEK
ncbi:hypothetical protein RhiirA4_480745 [Rhizophagus irregularis]|uniref:Uncharacterized protein n=1 Tax=Rhizophagus irregularis TaxID=588596 RepID=A0A2I1HID3_9GLOM|nr:hypothetical protein RhiirA4_480745 [Rhizophagus irregularis]